MNNIVSYIKENWLLCLIGVFFISWFTYLTFQGNQLCDCEKTEKYQDGTTRRHHSSGVGYYRYYHK
ncbi:hypothetical protein MKJ01_01465 [Chryseobacterium sp. SSA4.19]|uniref:hypothetical protein n=1 Tax=Chryseobacterium sp. SSA4.19 TaxID=2919915 RepID=UPI001F4D7CDB|nr:hypothetical protein [Chryseobacterium sp. SSA4.19]MCJ8152427.1 hypothetical protein [Chryseobacterium sp. SSA4.19]